MRKLYLAAALILLGSLRASALVPGTGPDTRKAVPPNQTSVLPFSLVSPRNSATLSGPATTIPSTPIIVAPSPLREPSMYPQSQGVLGPAEQNNIGFALGLPFGSRSGARRGGSGPGPVSGALANRMNSR